MCPVPSVSVVVPVYLDRTAAAYLPAAMDSLLAQEFTDWEAVVVDDGSPAPVEPLLPDDPRVRLVRHERNRGLGAALNTGLARATAPRIAYLPLTTCSRHSISPRLLRRSTATRPLRSPSPACATTTTGTPPAGSRASRGSSSR